MTDDGAVAGGTGIPGYSLSSPSTAAESAPTSDTRLRRIGSRDNAGAAVPAGRPTVDGNEPNYQVNALAPFLLITLLTPALEEGGAGGHHDLRDPPQGAANR